MAYGVWNKVTGYRFQVTGYRLQVVDAFFLKLTTLNLTLRFIYSSFHSFASSVPQNMGESGKYLTHG